MTRSVVIVGGSLAGIRCAGALRRGGFDGRITVLEPDRAAPYDRPPLSKEYLRGDYEEDRLQLVSDAQRTEYELEWVATAATAIDVDRCEVATDDQHYRADAVVIASGASPQRLPGAPHVDGIHVLRTLEQATRLREELSDDSLAVVVVGAGFIGAEVAATAADQGHEVTILEAASAPMARGLGERMGLLCGSLHAEHGVDLRLSTSVHEVLTRDVDGARRFAGVSLASGEIVSGDILVMGIGVVPNTGWLEDSSLRLDDGVVCNEYCEAAPNVYAAGDVARWYSRRFDEVLRVEHWENAVDQGNYVAGRILGDDAPYDPVPWFWSDQYEHKIQVAGRPHADDTIEIVTGSPDENRFAAIYGRGGRLTAVFGLNRPRHVMQYRRLLLEGATWQDALDHAASGSS